MDSQLSRELTRTLDEEISLYKFLLAVVQKERECIRQAAHRQLLDTVTLIEKNVRAIHEVKTQRHQVMDEIARAAGLPGDGLDLTAVIGVLPAEVAFTRAGLRANPMPPLGSHDLGAYARGSALVRIPAGSPERPARPACEILPLVDWLEP